HKDKPKAKGKISSAEITVFARQLTTMMGSGVPLVQAFQILGSSHDNKAMAEMLNGIKTSLEGGSQLSESLKAYPDSFDDLFCSLVNAGEQSGTLDKLLNEIANYKEKSESLKRKIKKATFYPVAVLVVAFVVTAILLIFVVPQFETLFQSVGGDLPMFTKLVVNLSEWMQSYWWIVFGAIGAGVFSVLEARKRSEAFRYKCDQLILRMPIFGDITQKAVVARFTRTLSTMSAAGMPLVEAMVSVATSSGNLVYRDAIFRMKEETESGSRLADTMESSKLFPNMVLQMVEIGEESGSLDDMLGKVADYYEEEVDAAVDGLTSLMEPMIMAFLGVVIGGLVIAMYLPIFKMGDAF
ncbi:MAG: type II secretion system F family protein, partial [Pseudomonadota bacterium]